MTNKPFYEELGEFLSTPDGIKKLNEKIFKDGTITINILAKDEINDNSKFYYHIKSLTSEGEFPEELKTSINMINSYLVQNGEAKGYKDKENNWSIFYLLKELITELKLNKFNYFRGQEKNWDTVPAIFRKKKDVTGNNLYSKFEKIYKKISQEFPEELDYIDLESIKDIEARASQLAILQHYGLPTALLDITENPYIAMLFMLSEERAIFDPKLEAYSINTDDTSKSIVSFVNKYKQNKRIRAQKGAFLNYEKLKDKVIFSEDKISLKTDTRIERVIIRFNFSVEDSISYLEAIIKRLDDDNCGDFRLELEKLCEKYNQDFTKLEPSIVSSHSSNSKAHDKTLNRDTINTIISTFQKGNGELGKQQYYNRIQQELITKLKEYEYYESDLFPDFKDYIHYKTKGFSTEEKNTKIQKLPRRN